MDSSSRRRAKHAIVLFLILAAMPWIIRGEDAARSHLNGLLEDRTVAEKLQRFMQEPSLVAALGDCTFEPLFGEWVTPKGTAPPFYLAFVVGKRHFPRIGQEVWVESISILVREETASKAVSIWLRVATSPDSGWIRLEDLASTDPTRSPLRGCHAPIVEGSLCTDCEVEDAQLYLRPRVDSSGKKIKLVPTCQSTSDRALGRSGIIRWLLDHRESLEAHEAREPRRLVPGLPTSSSKFPTTLGWTHEAPWPAERSHLVPPPEQPESVRRIGDLRPIDFLPAFPESIEDSETAGCVKIRAPRVVLEGNGFRWFWHPLAHARIPELDFLAPTNELHFETPEDGCLPDGQPSKNFNVELANSHLEARKMDYPNRVLRQAFSQNGPFVFLNPDVSLLETIVASNLFGTANRGLGGFTRHYYPWIGNLIKGVAIHQISDSAETSCHAQRKFGSLHLPLDCPGREGFSPKGLCDDVVRHELTHEVMGSVVEVATAGWNRKILNQDLDEALADFFALELSEDPRSSLYGENCQSDRENFAGTFGLGKMSRRNLTIGLRMVSKEIGREATGQLAILAALHGSASKKSFLRELLDWAEFAQLDPGPLCEKLKESTSYCDSRCPSGCARVDRFRPARPETLEVYGQFVASETCADYQLRVEEVEASIQLGSGDPPTQQATESEQFLGEVQLSGVTTPLKIVLDPCAVVPGGSTDEPAADELVVEGLPDDTVRVRASAAWMQVVTTFPIEQQDGPGRTWLLVSSKAGELSAYAVGADGDPGGHRLTDLRIQPGFTVDSNAVIQAWTFGNVPVSIELREEGERLSGIPRQGPGQPTTLRSGLPQGMERPLLLNHSTSDPRLELLAYDSLTLTVADWSTTPPSVRKIPWGTAIETESLVFGKTLEGTAIAVDQTLPQRKRLFKIRRSEAGPYLEELGDGWSVFANELPGVDVYKSGRNLSGRPVVEAMRSYQLDDSFCRAPPYLDVVKERILVLTCDGVHAVLDLAGDSPEWLRADRGAEARESSGLAARGIVAPSPGLVPIQRGRLGDGERPSWLVGPFVIRDSEGRSFQRFRILDLEGEELVFEEIVVTPDSVINTILVGPGTAKEILPAGRADGLEALLFLTNESVEVWRPRVATSPQ